DSWIHPAAYGILEKSHSTHLLQRCRKSLFLPITTYRSLV
ncbi:hypothetical protein CP082626L3_1015B, partial [Chlamydia psittaci 08-2626_L3]